MAIKVCPNGHHYNTDDNPTCPYCDKANSENDFDWSEMDLSMKSNLRTEALGESDSDEWEMKTKILDSNQGKNDSSFRQQNDEVWPGKTQPINVYGKRQENETFRAQDSSNQEYQHQHVVCWLVCIEGPDKGKDFVLYGAKNTIGRRNDSSVVLNDPKISCDGFPALIVYDDRKSHKFYLTNGNVPSLNNIEIRGEMLLGQSVINPYDEIRIEDTVLVFVPFCGDEFFWKEN